MTKIRLAGSRITKVHAERNPDFDGKISLGTAIKIRSAEFVKGSKDTLEIDYLFEVDYKDLGNVNVEGKLYISGDSKALKEIKKTSDKKDYKSKEQLAITTLVLQKASIKAMELEEDLGLPIHIKLPSVQFKE